MSIISLIFSLFKPKGCSAFSSKMCLQNQTVELGEEKKKKKRVVVIGGGAGGSVLAYSLRSVAEVILIDQ
jgi:NADPH-dependent 2,4-dienoyl-CoA reductase/sulfur reductase-like enzyme